MHPRALCQWTLVRPRLLPRTSHSHKSQWTNKHHQQLKMEPNWLYDDPLRAAQTGVLLSANLAGTAAVHTSTDVLVFADGPGAAWFASGDGSIADGSINTPYVASYTDDPTVSL